jgi:hypothetical protein
MSVINENSNFALLLIFGNLVCLNALGKKA